MRDRDCTGHAPGGSHETRPVGFFFPRIAQTRPWENSNLPHEAWENLASLRQSDVWVQQVGALPAWEDGRRCNSLPAGDGFTMLSPRRGVTETWNVRTVRYCDLTPFFGPLPMIVKEPVLG